MRQNKRNITFLKATAPTRNAPFRFDSLKLADMFTNWTQNLPKQTQNTLTSLLSLLGKWVLARRKTYRDFFKDALYQGSAAHYIFLTPKDLHVNFSIRDL